MSIPQPLPRPASEWPSTAQEDDGICIRPLRSAAELQACVELQKRTWGAEFGECVPPTLLRVSQRIGGVAAGAFDADDGLLGFVFGLAGVQAGEPVHWSHMLAVRPEARDLGLGQRLKQFQADLVRALGVRTMLWTYDPLVARNAHLNLNRLGARVTEFVPDMYGSTDSALHRTGTDRFVVAWRLDGRADAFRGGAAERDDQESALHVQIPPRIDVVQRASLDEARRWRQQVRAALADALGRGYRVDGFHRGDGQEPCCYVLRRARQPEPEDQPC